MLRRGPDLCKAGLLRAEIVTHFVADAQQFRLNAPYPWQGETDMLIVSSSN
jgi:hypothetical protein